MFHEDILLMSYCKYIKTACLISNMHCLELHLDNFKDYFLNIYIFLHPQIPDFQIVVSQPNIVLYINGKIIYSAFRWCRNLNFNKLTLMTGFVVQGHICIFVL